MDDNSGAVAHTTLVMDDTSICLCYDDLHWFLSELQSRGAPLGIHLSLTKTKILTSLTGQPPQLSPDNQDDLNKALLFLNPQQPTTAEITDGTRFLGHSIGNVDFTQPFITNRLHTISTNLDKVMLIPHDQTKTIMYRYSLATAISHLLWADILTQAPNSATSSDWSSPITTHLDSIHEDTFLQRITQHHNPLPNYARQIATLPERHGGLGIPNAHAIAFPSLIGTMTRSLRLASDTNFLSAYHANLIHDWPNSPIPLFQTFAHALALFDITPTATDSLHSLVLHLPPNIQHQLTNQTITRTTISQLIVATLPHLQPTLPSALSPLISSALHQPCRFLPFHLPDHLYKLTITRKLRLPISPSTTTTTCLCQPPSAPTALDPYGDHLFTCRKAPKTHASNIIRDALYNIL